ncbi:MAG: hypothetical protein M1113_00590 [Candidatus Thermoplasmatota archaeon]|nr:hypothetical protein [Candidatus Thermoplasmatota archaeon]
MKSSLLDTNVVFDIIYQSRDRHESAESFYKGFNNLELGIENIVHQECNMVLLKYASEFGSDLENYIHTREKHTNKLWDAMSVKLRKDILEKFSNDLMINLQGRSDGHVPFYREIITRSLSKLVRMTIEDLREYFLEMPTVMMRYLRNEIKSRFTVFRPFVDLEKKETYEFTSKLKEKLANPYFKSRQSEDRKILTSIIALITFGDANKNAFDEILFYTCDPEFLHSYSEIKASPPTLSETKYDNFLNHALISLVFMRPY